MEGYERINKSILHDFGICLGCGYYLTGGWCNICVSAEIIPFEIMHKDKIWLNTGRGFFISKIMKFGHFSNILYSIDTMCDWVFHKNPSIREDAYIYELSNFHKIYPSALFVGQHPNNPPTLEDTTTFYICKFVIHQNSNGDFT